MLQKIWCSIAANENGTVYKDKGQIKWEGNPKKPKPESILFFLSDQTSIWFVDWIQLKAFSCCWKAKGSHGQYSNREHKLKECKDVTSRSLCNSLISQLTWRNKREVEGQWCWLVPSRCSFSLSCVRWSFTKRDHLVIILWSKVVHSPKQLHRAF